MSYTIRHKRIQQMILEEVSLLILQGVVKDPRVNSLLSIHDVIVSKDFSFAKLYISSMENEDKLEDAVEALNHAAGFIQSKVAKKIKTRNTPKLRFYADNSIKRGVEMTKKLEDLEH